jgi:glycosyltransferase involved in cell wall biosynthesis
VKVKPVLFVTGHAPFDRVGAFARLAEREDVAFALFGGRRAHGPPGAAAGEPPGDGPVFPHRHTGQAEIMRLAASGRYRAVICGTAGRLALPAAWAGARRAGVPFLLWTSLWAHPRSPAHALSWALLRRLYRHADAVVTYGPHVSAYVRARGARNVHVAPQAVDNDFWRVTNGPRGWDPINAWPPGTRVRFLFVGRAGREKGLGVLLSAWRASGLAVPAAAFVLVGEGSTPPWVPAGGAVAPCGAREAPEGARDSDGVTRIGPLEPARLRNFYGAADVVVLPSIRTRTFREPWGLVANEAMNQVTAIIASDEVGAAAGGLIRDGRNGLIVPAGDEQALAAAMVRLTTDADLRERLARTGARDVLAFDQSAWAAGFSAALASVGASRER